MTTTGFKTKLKNGEEEVDGYLVGFTGRSLEELEALKKEFDLQEEQDVVNLAISLLKRFAKEKQANAQ